MRDVAPDGAVVGGANRDRTGDLLVANQTLSQLSYGPFFIWPKSFQTILAGITSWTAVKKRGFCRRDIGRLGAI